MDQLKLVEAVSNDIKVNKSLAKKAVKSIINNIMKHLKEEGKVSISGLGVFRVKETNPRVGRNPKTGESVQVPAGKRVGFRAGRKLKSYIKE